MALLQKMYIQGIRNFGPDSKDKQVIEFSSPVTLILGANGCGKTTIIECLKYATTGDLPPGTGKSFVFNPKLAGKSDVHAQLKLQFADTHHNHKIVVTRSLQASYNGKTISFKTLDSTIRKTHLETGQTADISGKCADVNAEMSRYFSITKPILEYVIFCHQEESNWPLDENKKVKDRFDNIFNATKYVKCIESIRKLLTEMQGDCTKASAQLPLLQKFKEAFAKKYDELNEKETRLNANKDMVAKIQEEMKPLLERLDELREMEDHITKLSTDKGRMETSLKHLQEEQSTLRMNLTAEYMSSEEVLRKKKELFLEDTASKEKEKNELNLLISQYTADVADKLKKEQQISVDIAKLQSEESQHRQHLKERDHRLKSFAQKNSFENLNLHDELSDCDVQRIKQCLKKAKLDVQKQNKDEQLAAEEQEQNIQRQIEQANCKKVRLEQDIKNKKENLARLHEDIRADTEKLNNVQKSSANIVSLTGKISRLSDKISDMEKTVNVDELRAEICRMRTEAGKLEEHLKALKKEREQLQEHSVLQSQINGLQSDYNSKERNTKILLNKNEDIFQKLLGEKPRENLKTEVKVSMDKLNREIHTITQSLQSALHNQAAKEADDKHLLDEINKKEDELRKSQKQLYDKIKSKNLREAVDELRGRIKVQQDTKGMYESAKNFYERYIKKLGVPSPNCPLCHRGFSESTEVTELIQELNDKLSDVPERLQGCMERLAKDKREEQELLELYPVHDRVQSLETKELPELRMEKEAIACELKAASEAVTQLQQNLNSKKELQKEAMTIVGDASVIEQNQMEIRNLQQKIRSLQSNLPPITQNTGRTLNAVSDEEEEKSNSLGQLREQIELTINRVSKHTEHVQELKSQRNDLVQKKLQMDTDIQQQAQIEEHKEKLATEAAFLKDEIEETQDQLEPVMDEVTDLQSKKDVLKKEWEKHRDHLQDMVNKLNSEEQQIISSCNLVEEYRARGNAEKLEHLNIQLNKAENEKIDAERTLSETRKILDDLKVKLQQSELRRRLLDDALLVHEKKQKEKELRANLDILTKKLGDLNSTSMEKEKKIKSSEHRQLQTEYDQAQGRQRELIKSIQDTRRELEDDQLKHAHKRHSEKLVTLQTLNMGRSDLKRYFVALEESILAFHNERMKAINQILFDLWKSVYRGNDIDYIRIRADAGSAAAETRRNYSYRVTFVKDKIELDMRGQCSAGQKVLASLLIRIALAETFSANCAILALDEPTTNLDRKNVSSLAEALKELVTRGKRNQNFQLIVITHDEEFISKLTDLQTTESFMRIFRNEKGRSAIGRYRARQ